MAYLAIKEVNGKVIIKGEGMDGIPYEGVVEAKITGGCADVNLEYVDMRIAVRVEGEIPLSV